MISLSDGLTGKVLLLQKMATEKIQGGFYANFSWRVYEVIADDYGG